MSAIDGLLHGPQVVVVVLVVVVGSGTHGVSAVSQAECPAEAGG